MQTVEQLYNSYIQSVWKDTYQKLHPSQQEEMKRCFVAGFISATSEMAKLHSQSNAAIILGVEALKTLAKNNNVAVQTFRDWIEQATKFTDIGDVLVTEKN